MASLICKHNAKNHRTLGTTPGSECYHRHRTNEKTDSKTVTNLLKKNGWVLEPETALEATMTKLQLSYLGTS